MILGNYELQRLWTNTNCSMQVHPNASPGPPSAPPVSGTEPEPSYTAKVKAGAVLKLNQ